MNDLISSFREISEERRDEFLHKGYKGRYFFPYKVYYVPKCGPDGLKLAKRTLNISDPNKLWEVVLYGVSPQIDEFPRELFLDDDIVWHQQQLDKTGQVATANLVIDGSSLYTMVHISDLVQRISRWREYKTRIQSRFGGWHHMLLNSILNFAAENNFRNIYSATSDLVIEEHSDPGRRHTVKRDLFERIYDRDVNMHFKVERRDGWWLIDVSENRDRLVVSEKKEEIIQNGTKTICLFHDTERGLGHIDEDPILTEFANQNAPKALEEMLKIEEEMNVKATYNVVGSFLNDVRGRIEKDGHCIAFHSYDHQIVCDHEGTTFRPFSNLCSRAVRKVRRKLGLSVKPPKVATKQLNECRRIDYRIKGYRPPQSRITPELSDNNLCYHNFEWLASSPNSLGARSPELQNRIVKIPILFDDYGMYKRSMEYDTWEQMAIEMIKENDFVAFGLHDCYAHYWLPHYKAFLEKIRALGKFKTFNEVANEVFLANSK